MARGVRVVRGCEGGARGGGYGGGRVSEVKKGCGESGGESGGGPRGLLSQASQRRTGGGREGSG